MAYIRKTIDISEVEHQKDICEEIRNYLNVDNCQRFAMVDTYGCQQNEADSEKIRGYLQLMGYEFTDDEFKADIIVVNTCAVREHAEMRVLGNVGALNHTKKNKPGQIICVCGCMVQQEHMAEKIKFSYPIVNLVFGPHDLWRFPELLQSVILDKKRYLLQRRVMEQLLKECHRIVMVSLKRGFQLCMDVITSALIVLFHMLEAERDPDFQKILSPKQKVS
jgi:2-methylthioadenine synthetase